ncbi:MAG: hypothetical protein ABIJ86_16665 [Spirochaetota bacterium]
MIPFFSFLFRAFRSMLSRLWAPALPVLLLAGLLVLVLASSCFFPTSSEKAKPASTAKVVFTVAEDLVGSWDKLGSGDDPVSRHLQGSMDCLDGSRALVYDPAPLPDDLLVFLQGTGPGGALLTEVPVTGAALEMSLCTGDWVFDARAEDGEGVVFLAGTAAATVHPATGAMVAIALSPVPGLGSLTVAYTMPTQVSASAVWNCDLTAQEGLVVAAWEDQLEASSRAVAGIPSGYYMLGSRLLDGELLLSGRVDLVRLLAGRSTAIPLALEIPLASVGLDVELDHRAPVGVSAALLSRAAVRGFPLRVRATGPVGFPSGVDYRWSAMGTPLAQGELADIPSLGLPRSGVIDLVAFSGTSAGAAGLAYSLAEPVAKDSWSFYAAVGLADEPASQVLGRPAMIAASLVASQGGSGAAAAVVAIASDETSSKLELWMSDPASGEMVPGASAAIRIGGTVKKATILRISGNGSYVGAAASESGWIWLVPVGTDGSLGTPVELVGGSGDLSGMGYVRGLAFSPSADRLYVLSNSDRSVYVFQRMDAAWALLQRFALDDQPCGLLSVLKALAISSDGSRLAVAAASSDVVAILDTGAGGLEWRGEARRTAGFTDIDYPQSLVFSPGGRLAVGCKDSGALVILDVDAVPPATVAVSGATDGLPGAPAALSWSADGQFIGLSSLDASTIIRLDANGLPQGLSVFDAADAAGLGAPAGLAMVGNSLYLACPDGQALVILGRLPE